MRILEHVEDREIGGDVAGRQRGERHGDETELRERQRLRRCGQNAVPHAHADDRNNPLNQGEAERQDQRIMSGLRDHFVLSFVGSGFLE